MSSHVAVASSAIPNHSSTITTQPSAIGSLGVAAAGASAPAPRPNPPALIPPPIPPFHRADTLHIKQKLHDALGEAGLPYWKTLNAYLLGQVGRDELANLVRGWLKGDDRKWHFSFAVYREIPRVLIVTVLLHNQLLKSLLHNASSPQVSHPASSPLSMHKRRRGGVDAPDFDSDATFIEPRDRVRQWVMGMGGRERERVRRSAHGGDDEEGGEAAAVADAGVGEWDVSAGGGKRKWTVFQTSEQLWRSSLTSAPAHPPLAQGSHLIPSSTQLGSRLSQVAKLYGLDVDPDKAREVGEFMGVGLQSHLGDMLHSVVHLTGRDRPGEDTMRVPLGTKNSNVERVREEHPVPKPTLQTMQHLFTMTPSLQPQISPTLYKLGSGLTVAELENMAPPPRKASMTTPPNGMPMAPPSLLPAQEEPTLAVAVSPKKAASAIQAAAGQGKIEAVSQTLADTGLLKIDKAGHEHQAAEGERKREKKHNLHWKYEDPAIILKDLLG